MPMDVRSISEIAGSIYLLFRLDRSVHSRPPSIFSYRPHSLPSSNTQQQPAGYTCRLPIPSPLHFFSFDFCKYFSFFKTPQFLAAPLFYGYYFKTTFNIILLKGVSFSFNISIGVHCFSCQLYSSGILSPTL